MQAKSEAGRGVTVIGSINVDFVSRVTALPRPGETVAGGDLEVLLGGKGANQAVAAARAGARTAMIGAVGEQSFGLDLRAEMAGYGVAADTVATVPGPSGAALIAVDAAGENAIAVSPGANARVTAAAPQAGYGAILLAQLEIPAKTVLAHFRAAKRAGATTILNAAPVVPVPDDLFALTDVLIVNETELATCSGREIAQERAVADAARALRREGQRLIVTLGGRGVLALDGDDAIRQPARAAEVVDTTGAGDCFCGWLAAGLAEGLTLRTALTRAGAAAALSVGRPGAAPAMPGRAEVEALLAADEP